MFVVILGLSAPILAGDDSVADLPFEQLLQTEIVTADKIARQISDAPSAVSIVTAEDIRTFGYRSLSDILDSMRGLAMADDGAYGYLSGRGYGSPGATAGYAGRITLLIDGYRAPDNYFGQTYFGNDALLDVELIERVEYIPGSGSSSYGDSAFLGVINVVTKRARDISGTEVSTEFGSHGLKRSRVTFGRQFESGVDLVLAASGLASDGRNLPATIVGDGADRFESDRNRRYFLKATYRNWTLESGWVNRWTPYPYDRQETDSDASSFTRLRYDGKPSPDVKTSIDLYYGRYRYRNEIADGSWFYSNGGTWRGGDAKLVGTWFERQTIIVGTEYRDDFQIVSEYATPSDGGKLLASRRTVSLYAYDDIALSGNLQVSIGGRQDARNDHGSTFSPRGALIWTPVKTTTLKLSAGQAHRQLTPDIEFRLSDPQAERATTTEFVWEQTWARKTRSIASLYRYRIDNYLFNLSTEETGPVYVKGAELELEHVWEGGMRLRTSYAWQDNRDQFGQLAPNLARHIAKVNLAVPLVGQSLRAGLGIRYLGRRLNLNGESEPGVLIADLTLSGRWHDWFASASVRNLGNTGYNHVSGAFGPDGIYPADRRNFWLQLGYDFK